MKRTIRLVIIFISVVIVVGGIALWRNHYLKIKNAEPVKVYKDTPEQQGTSPKKTSSQQKKVHKSESTQPDTLPEDTTVQSDDTDIESEPRETAQPTDDSTTPEATDNTGELTVHPVFTDIVIENLPPEAAAALKLYDESQLAADALTTELTPLLKARPVDWNAVNSKTEKLMQINQQRIDALEILALYSDKASKQFKEAERILDQTNEGMETLRKAIEMIETIEDIGKEIEEGLK